MCTQSQWYIYKAVPLPKASEHHKRRSRKIIKSSRRMPEQDLNTDTKTPPLNEDLQVISGFWERGNQFSLGWDSW